MFPTISYLNLRFRQHQILLENKFLFNRVINCKFPTSNVKLLGKFQGQYVLHPYHAPSAAYTAKYYLIKTARPPFANTDDALLRILTL